MGLFDVFKKKPTVPKENNLEMLLRKAAAEPAYRPEFYNCLLNEKLVVISNKSNMHKGTHTVEKDTSLEIRSMADGKIPVFTSTDKIFDKGVIKEKVGFVQMEGRALLDLTKGATLILNPYSDYGKELLPAEIELILNGKILDRDHKKITVEKETNIQIGEPAVYPEEIVKSLCILFKTKPAVKRAYVAWIYNPSSGEPPHYVFALDIEGEKQQTTNEAGFTVQQFLNKEDIVDFIQISNDGGISDYFLDTEPFYKR